MNMKTLLALCLCTLATGCAGLSTYQVRSADDAIRIVKEAHGKGCQYTRVSGDARPFANVELRNVAITTLGTQTTIQDCMESIPPEARSLLGIEPPGAVDRAPMRLGIDACAVSYDDYLRRTPAQRRALECLCGGTCPE